jgi:hypothetical protein
MKNLLLLAIASACTVIGLAGVLFLPYQHGCPPGPKGTQCSGLSFATDYLPLLYASVGTLIVGLATLGILAHKWNSTKAKTPNHLQ